MSGAIYTGKSRQGLLIPTLGLAEYSPRTIIDKSFVEMQTGSAMVDLKRCHDEALKIGDKGPQDMLAIYVGASVGLVLGQNPVAEFPYTIVMAT